MNPLRTSFLATALLLLAPLSWAAPAAYFSSRDNLQAEIAKAIDQCQVSLEAALFELSSRPLAQALQRAAGRGVQVRLLLEPATVRQAMRKDRLPGNLSVRYLHGRRNGVMHHKFAIFDNKELITGSFNWTAGAQYANHENILVEDDGGIVSAYGRQFEDLWRQARRSPGNKRFRVARPAQTRRHQ